MNDQFDLAVDYKGKEHIFRVTFSEKGYVHRFSLDVNGHMVIFEPDEERNYRAILSDNDVYTGSNKNIDIDLLKKIIEAIEKLSPNA